MKKMIKKIEIIKIFKDISKFPYDTLLLRNTENELPSKLSVGKDIDLLVKKKNRNSLRNYLKRLGYIKINHPWKKVPKDSSIIPFDYYLHSSGAILDINYQLVHCNLTRTKFLLHRDWLQNYVWKTFIVRKFGAFSFPFISLETEFIISSVRCVVDKRRMTDWNFKRLLNCYNRIKNKKIVKKELEFILGNNSALYLKYLNSGKWNNYIIDKIKLEF